MLDRDAAPRKRPSPSLSGISVGSADIAAFLQFQTKYYSSTTLYYTVLLCTTEYYTYYSSTTLYYKVLLQYYSVLQSITPVLVRTTKYYSSTTPYYKVLLRYYSVLQCNTPVLFRTTKCYSSTTPYYKVLLQYYSVVLLQY